MDPFAFIIAAAFCISTVQGYETYTVEQNCTSGNLSVLLSGSGPGSAALLRTTDRLSYSVSGECRIRVRTAEHHLIVASIREVGFRIHLDGTCQDYIRIEGKPMCSPLYRLEEQHHIFSSGNTLDILHHVSEIDKPTGQPGAKLTITALATGGRCSSGNGFRCRNGFCVWYELRCDSHNNCGDLSDEQDCDSPGSSRSTALIILAAIIVLLLLIMCTATLLCTKNERVRRFSNRLRSRTISYMPRFNRTSQ